MTTLTKNQTKHFTKVFGAGTNKCEKMIVTIRHDDQCGNGHNTFAITAEVYRAIGQDGTMFYREPTSCGCMHGEIEERFPELAHLIKWHGCSTDGPMHYVANTRYHASERDHWGLLKGEFRQSVNQAGVPLWEMDRPTTVCEIVAGNAPPEPVTYGWKPCGKTGKGKERDLDAARRTAVWPDATDEELTEPGLEARLAVRLPKLLEDFKAAIESIGFTY